MVTAQKKSINVMKRSTGLGHEGAIFLKTRQMSVKDGRSLR
jgi:hypothetical protein